MITKLEIRTYIKTTVIMAIIIGIFMVMVINMFPMLEDQMGGMVRMVEKLGLFSDAFKIDGSMLTTLIGYYGMEMENMLGIGGAFYAGYLGIKMVAKEESSHTAEFLLTHPITRISVFLQKTIALIVLVLLLNIIVVGIAWFGINLSDQSVSLATFLKLHFSITMVQVCIGLACLGFSAFLRQDNLGFGLGYVFILYVINIFINMFQEFEKFKYIVPFQFAYAADILENGINWELMGIVFLINFIIWLIGAIYYNQKNIYA